MNSAGPTIEVKFDKASKFYEPGVRDKFISINKCHFRRK
jgi:hypothetical protein